jgi:hypothetical protein
MQVNLRNTKVDARFVIVLRLIRAVKSIWKLLRNAGFSTYAQWGHCVENPRQLLRFLMLKCLKGRRETQSETSRWADGVAGEQAAKVDDIENVGQVLSVDLEAGFKAV